MKKLGDSHNFGKFVFEEQELIFKPRPLVWEYLFLSDKSPVRSLIDTQCQLRKITSPFEIAPNLNVQFKDSRNGHIEKIALTNLKYDHRIGVKDFSSIGSLLALCFWFGIGDLHIENIAIGLNKKNQLVCFPIDIECLLDQMTHVKQTLLTHSDRISRDKCGLALIWSLLESGSLENKLLLIRSFVDSINLYNSMAKEIFDSILNIENIKEYPIRIILRDTEFYSRAIDNQSFSGLLEAEKIQMLRGEIPYFFRIPSSSSLFYYETKDKAKIVEFEETSLNLPSPVCLIAEGHNFLIKAKTTTLSIKYLAEKLYLNSESKRIGHAEIICDNRVISFEEHKNKIIYSDF